jgi:hypothetical protein
MATEVAATEAELIVADGIREMPQGTASAPACVQ